MVKSDIPPRPIHGSNWLQRNRFVVFHRNTSRVRITSKNSVTLNRRPGDVLQDCPDRVPHPGIEFAVLTGVLDKVLVKDDTTGFENHDRG